MIRNFITPVSIANSILMDKSFKGVNLLVEGEIDNLFFIKFTEKQNCRITVAFGNEKVIEILDILELRNFRNAVGVIDSDFRIILNKIPKNPNVILTETHDIETLIIKSPTFDYLTNLYVSKEKLDEFSTQIKNSFLEYILELAKPIALFRLMNEKENLQLRFKPELYDGKPLKYNEFIDKDKFSFSGWEKLITTVKNYYNQNPSLSISKTKEYLEKMSQNNFNLLELCNGHDITHILSIGFQKKIGSKNIDAGEIDKTLVNSYDSSYFKKTELFKKLITWQTSNSHLNIFKVDIFGDDFYISNPLENIIKIQINSLNGLAFQNFIDKLFELLYEEDYLSIKQKRDKGCDGILNEMVLSIYSPEKYRIETFKSKTIDDFNKYEKYWQNKYKNWLIIFNGEITGEMKLFVDNIYQNANKQ